MRVVQECMFQTPEMSQAASKQNNFEGCEDVWVEIISKTTVGVGSVYRHPRSILSEFKEAYLNSLSKKKKKTKLYSTRARRF